MLNYLISAILTWWITDDFFAPGIGIAINFFLFALFSSRIPIISVFGVFFLISMLNPAIYGFIWMYQLVEPIGNYYNFSYWGFTGLWFVAMIYTVVIAANTFINASTLLARHSPFTFGYHEEMKRGNLLKMR